MKNRRKKNKENRKTYRIQTTENKKALFSVVLLWYYCATVVAVVQKAVNNGGLAKDYQLKECLSQ